MSGKRAVAVAAAANLERRPECNVASSLALAGAWSTIAAMPEPCCTVCRLGGVSAAASDRPLLRAEPHEVNIVAFRAALANEPPLASYRPAGPWVTFGRAADNHLVLGDPALSRRQGAFHFRDGMVYVVDTESACGTLLDGEKVASGPLREGSIVLVGNVALRVER